jgi:L-alanine-DL-glutamate epimerase-like enolase superfamily enzyme
MKRPEDPPKIANGRLKLKEQPGMGLTLSEAALKKFGERIL